MSKTMNAIIDETHELFQLFSELEERTLEMNEVERANEMAILADWLGETQQAFEAKVDAYVAVIREFTAKAQAAKDESKRLADRAKAFEGKVASLKDMLQFSMNRLGMDKCKTAYNTVSISANGGRPPLEIDEAVIPADFLRITTTVDKVAIHEALKAGIDVEGVKVLEPGKSLRIR